VLIAIAAHLAVFLSWSVLAGLALLYLPLPWGAVVGVAAYLAILRGYVFRADSSVPRRSDIPIPLRTLRGPVLTGTLAVVPVFLVFSWSLAEVYVGLVPIPPESLHPFQWLTDEPLGRLSLVLLAIGVAPMLEECFFRGLIQRPLVKRWGPAPGIAAAGAMFAAVHFLPWILPVHFLLGLAFGVVAYATRSVYAAIMLHAANNTMAVLGLPNADALEPRGLIWDGAIPLTWWIAVLGLVASTAVGARLLRCIDRAARAADAWQ
jgi:membrane protease YdiL (CAAX protease family)